VPSPDASLLLSIIGIAVGAAQGYYVGKIYIAFQLYIRTCRACRPCPY
jgi:ABC-type microcin C transport system permease subunit YejE